MIALGSVRWLLEYNDWANGALLAAAAEAPDAALDQAVEMGVGSLRRTLLHIYNGEVVWLARWQGRVEVPWPSEQERVGCAELTGRFRRHYEARDAYLATLHETDLPQIVTYRDSRGSLFTASRADMLVQAFTHSAHHRAQAVNMLRRTAGRFVELDYMMWRRRPV